MSGRQLWRMNRPNSLADLSVTVIRDRPLPEVCVTMKHRPGREGWVTTELHLSWAEAHTLAEALTDWLWRTQPSGPEHPPAAGPAASG